MSTFPTAQPTFAAALRTRSLGAKFFLILLLALGMSISGFFVEGLTTERAELHGVLAASTETPTQQPTTILGIHLADSYRSIRRSLHYITLFLGLVFLTYFLFEVSTNKSVHPAQYALVGVAQTIFYLLLLSLAEHLGFDLSFLIAAVATVALFSLKRSGSSTAANSPSAPSPSSLSSTPSSTSSCASRPTPCSSAPSPASPQLPSPCTSPATSTGMEVPPQAHKLRCSKSSQVSPILN